MGILDLLKNNEVNYVLTQQDNVNGIITAENNRLNAKSNSIQQAKTSQDRLIALNQNYSNRYNQYNYIIIIIVIALILFLGITLIQRNMEEPPTNLFTFLTVIIFGFAFIYIIIIYNRIMSRSNMDYDQLNISTPLSAKLNENQQQSASEKGDLLGSIISEDACVGATCCKTKTTWDPTSQSCRALCTSLPNKIWNATDEECVSAKSAKSDPNKTYVTDPFSTLSMYPISKNTQSMSIQPYTVSEYDGYMKV